MAFKAHVCLDGPSALRGDSCWQVGCAATPWGGLGFVAELPPPHALCSVHAETQEVASLGCPSTR